MNYPYFVWESISINVCNALLFNAFCSCRNQFLKELAYFSKSFFVRLFYRLPGKITNLIAHYYCCLYLSICHIYSTE